MRYVYADNSATTALSPKVLEKMMPYLTEVYGNPSSIYTIGAKARAAVETARENIAKNLGAANPNEIYFTSGGSESDNWALKGVCHALKAKGKKHIITSKFEHHAILHTCEALEKEGFEVTYLDVYENGIVHPEDVENAIREDTAIVSIMYANNEIGTIQPISEIGAICRKHGVLFHTDAVQAAGYVKIDVQKENIDLLSMTAHKLHGQRAAVFSTSEKAYELKTSSAAVLRRGTSVQVPKMLQVLSVLMPHFSLQLTVWTKEMQSLKRCVIDLSTVF